MKTIDELISFRKNLHQHAEVSGHEQKTNALILEHVSQLKNVDVITAVGGYGIIVIFKGEKPGNTLLFRADMDALPIRESNSFPYKSANAEVSHKCGHDGHTTILLGLAQQLSQTPPDKGAIMLLFQASEETGEGARLALQHPIFKEYTPDFVFALHNLPHFPLQSIIVKDNAFTASVHSLIIKYRGKTSHASEPENGINPSNAIAELLLYCNSRINPDCKSEDFALITPVYTHIGEKTYGTSAGFGETHFTLRTWDYGKLLKMTEQIQSEATRLAITYKLDVIFNITDSFASNNNNKFANDIIRKAAYLNQNTIIEKDEPFKWGEDFGLFTQKYGGAMFGIGAGIDCPALHNPDYDFPDELIETGIKMMGAIIRWSEDNNYFQEQK